MSNIPAAIRATLTTSVRAYRGDDLARALLSFRGMSAADLEKKHGNSGKKRREILTEYQRHDTLCADAVEFLQESGD